MLDRAHNAGPMYRIVAQRLSEQIAAGQYQVGDRLPSEHELARTLGVSRATIVKCFDELERTGVVDRRQGSGTFVAERPLRHGLTEIVSFTDFTRSSGAVPSQRLLDYQVNEAGQARDDLLENFGPDVDLVVLMRLRLSDDVAVGLHRIALPRAVLEKVGLGHEQLKDAQVSIYRHLSAHGLQPVTADEWLRAVSAPREVAKHLGAPANSAMLRVRRLSRSQDGDLVEAVDAFYLGSLYEYHAVLSAPSPLSGEGARDGSPDTTRLGGGVRSVAR
jgi:GntR family transcriptional regulator